MGQTFGRSMGAMRGRKRVIDIQIAQSRQLLGKGRVILFFFRVEAHIFQQNDIAILHGGDHGFGLRTNAIIGPGNALPDGSR